MSKKSRRGVLPRKDAPTLGAICSRRDLRHEHGQSLVLIAMAMVAMVAMLGLVLDAGYAYAQRRLVQTAVDAAALGAAQAVASENATDASVLAIMQDYANRNSPPSGITVVGTYIAPNDSDLTAVGNGSIPQLAKGVRVVGQTTFNTFFMGIIGMNNSMASASATAKFPDPIGPGNWAIWAGSTTNCASGTIGWNASSASILGGLRSNGNMQVGGGGGGTTINGNVETVGGVQGPNINYAGTVPYPVEGVVEPSPYRFRIQDFQLGGVAAIAAGSQYYSIAGDLTKTTMDHDNHNYFDNHNNVLRTGLYYVTGNVDFTGGVTGTVTIVARGKISIKGGTNQLILFQPAQNACSIGGIALFTDMQSGNVCADSGNVIELTGSTISVEGLLYAPNGRISLSGSQTRIIGALVGQTVDIAGSNLTLRWAQYCPNTGLAGEYLMK
ncbi:MAG: pilus assembly protein TadG-related protein [Dehalococcoidia bacterium]|nr:pilus assembly protein TadG-related protein [Dehalococcoidia bacterium]